MAWSKRKILMFLVIALITALCVAAIVIPDLSTPRILMNHRRAVANVRIVHLAQQRYAAQHAEIGFACSLRELAESSSDPASGAAFVDEVLASGTKAAYRFNLDCATGIQKATAYSITAVPTTPGTTGTYAICADQSGEIWYSESGSSVDCLLKRTPISKKHL